jgi:hypothetical protein
VARCPSDTQALVHDVRALLRRAVPDARECVYHGALNYGPSTAPGDRIIYIAPQGRGYVNLGFSFGAQLDDPDGLLEGTGARMRHVKIRSVEVVEQPGVERLVRAAWAAAPDALATLHAQRRQRRTMEDLESPAPPVGPRHRAPAPDAR